MAHDPFLLTNAIAGLTGSRRPPSDEPLTLEEAAALAALLIAELAPLQETRLDIPTLKREEPDPVD